MIFRLGSHAVSLAMSSRRVATLLVFREARAFSAAFASSSSRSLEMIWATDAQNRGYQHQSALEERSEKKRRVIAWREQISQGHHINPCNSPHHPAVVEAGLDIDAAQQKSIQEAYTPASKCFGCGPANHSGLGLKSYRTPSGLRSEVVLDESYCAFPGVINGGIIATLFECHGNWTAAIALMDRSCLPRPALTMTSHMSLDHRHPAPPNRTLVVSSEVVQISEGNHVGNKPAVKVHLVLSVIEDGQERELCSGTGIFKKLGALRAL